MRVTRLADAAARGIRVPDALRTPPPVDRLVVCHGDACAPNTLVTDAGTWSGIDPDEERMSYYRDLWNAT